MRDRRLSSLVLAGFVLFLVSALSATTGFAQTCQTYTGLTYSTYVDRNGVTQPLLLDLMVPSSSSSSGAGPVPLVIWIHGGGWKSGSRAPMPARVTDLCARGYAVASPDYRLTTVALWPAQIQDVKAAVRWLRENALSYGIDPDRFGVWGESAGAHLASLLGTSGGVSSSTVGNTTVLLEDGGDPLNPSSRVQAVVDWYGATDFLQMRFYPSSVGNHDASTSDESRLMGAPIQQVPERVATANPITYVSQDDPPFLVMHGTIDKTNAFNQSQLLVDSLRVAGVPVTFRPVLNAGHGGSLFLQTAAIQPVWDFFDAVLGGVGEDTVSVTAGGGASEAGPSVGTFTISRMGSAAADLLVRWAVSGTARPGADYAALSGSTLLPAGTLSATVTVTPVDDSLIEGDETVVLAVAPDAAYRVDAEAPTAVLTLADNDSGAGLPVIQATATDSSAAEAGSDAGAFTITRDGTVGSLTVSYSLAGTATNGSDYGQLSGSVTIPAGQSSVTVPVPVINDSALETGETVLLTLNASVTYVVGTPATAGVAIADDDLDPAKPIVSVSPADSDAAEPGTNTGGFFVWRTGSTTADLAVGITATGTAQSGADYAAFPSTVTIPAGADRVQVTVTPLDDWTTEPVETVGLGVVPAAAILLAPYTGTLVSIADDDPPGTPELVSVAISPGSVGSTQSATGTVTLDSPAFAGGAAVSLASGDTNVATVPATVNVPEGSSTATFTITTKSVATATAVTITASRRGLTRSASLTVQPPAVSGLTLTPATFLGGCQSSTGKVTLTAKAPTGGLVVPLTNTDPVALVPASVTVAAGSTSASFPVTAPAVTSTQNGAVTASYGGGSKSVSISVRPIGLADLVLTPNPVTGSQTVTATVTLQCAAAPGDIAVGVTSSSPSLATPSVPTLTIPAGSTTGTFTLSTIAVSATSTSSIRATANGSAKSVTLTVNP